jgi:hypothetical protein
MQTSLPEINWHKSRAHLLLLSKFLRPSSIDEFAKADYWNIALGENAKQAIKRFIDEELLLQANLEGQMDYKFKATELKSMLKERGLTVSGRKDELISRLIQADDPDNMKKSVKEITIVLCSEQGREITEKYLAYELAKRTKLDEQIWEYLRQRKFKEASLAVASYEAQQVFPRGLGINWNNHSPAPDIEALNAIFAFKPKTLLQLENNSLEILRISAGMDYLWGTNNAQWLRPDFETGLPMEKTTAIRMFLSNAYYHRSLAQYRTSGVVIGVQILSENCCEACRKLSGKKFNLNAVPELPYELCTLETGCRCTAIPIVPT